MYQHPEFSDRNNLTGNLLGHAGLEQLHRMDAFQWLNGQLAEQLPIYLRSLLGLDHGLVAHIQKAWPLVCARNCVTVDLHSHRNALLSAVFYLLTDPAKERGKLEFEAPDEYFSHVMAIPTATPPCLVVCSRRCPIGCWCSLRICAIGCSPNKRSGNRYSVSYDLVITTAPGKGREMRTPHPMDWVPLGS